MRRLHFPPIGRALRLGVAANGLALVKTSRLFGGAPLALAEQPLDLFAPDALAPGLRMLLSDLPVKGWPVSVVLADPASAGPSASFVTFPC